MPSVKFDTGSLGRAERQFREAFERLKQNRPNLLSKGSRVSQNNVAKEAGVDPSALRRARFPLLTEEIRRWIEDHHEDPAQKSPRQVMLGQRSRNRVLRERIGALTRQRDDALSKLVNAEARIVELIVENERLRAHLPPTNVVPLRPAETGISRD